MQSSPLRARRESQASGTDAPAVAGQGADNRPWFRGLFGLFGSKPAGQSAADPNANALLAFPSEVVLRPDPPVTEVLTKPAPKTSQPVGPRLAKFVRPALLVVGVIVLPSLTLLAIRSFPLRGFTAAQPQTGKVTIDTRAVSSEVLVDGAQRGRTPITLSLAPGAHTITVRTESDERVVPLMIAAGADITQYFEMKVGQPTALFGRVSVVTDPPGARITIDARPRGVSPITVSDLTVEEHKVTATTDAGSVERTVMVTAGTTASVMFSLPKASGPVGGWLSISAPFDLEVVENEDVIGTSGTSRIMLAAGRHSITLTNRTVGFQESRKVEVTAGKTVAIRVDPPKVSVSVNARPWAEVSLDGNSIGQTPIANLLVSVGPHDVTFKHPQFGERSQTIMVTAKGPNRIAADLTK
jgi:PEGA domain